MVGVNEIKVRCPNSLSHLAVALTVEYTKGQIPVYIEFGSNNLSVEITPKPAGNFQLSTVLCICRFLARICSPINLYGQTVLEKTEVDHWLEFSNRKYSVSEFKEKLQNLNQALSSITYLVGHELSLADICVWCMLYENKHWQTILADRKTHVNIARWYRHLLTLDNFSIVTKLFPEMAESNTRSKTEDVGKFVDLPGAEMGNVVVRFPPEASGFLHIGHAKAALLNAYYQNMFNGKLIMRFDDTNPEKEKEDFEKVILEDVAMLHIKPDIFTYTSDHFEFILQKCEELIKKELAYVDDTDAETMKLEREKKTESKNRANGIQKNLSMWAEMGKGSDYGKQCCVRAKIDMQSDNGCLRDPTLYRCKAMAHPRTGNKFNVYPTYDFACPIVDSIEGVTHALRTTEYHDRDDQYFWVLDKLKLRKLHIYEYSRLNMTHTVLSKRKLTWFVEQGIVNGWDDPRMPTVRGVLRCGMTVEGLKQFIVAQGSSRSIVVMEWDKIWSFNKKIIDPIAPRFNAVETDDKVQVLVQNAEIHTLEVARHPKNNDLGNKTITVGPKLFVDYADAEAMRVGENVTFINWGNLMVKEIVKNSDNRIDLIKTELNLENKDYKKTLKVTWVCDNENTPLIPCACIYYDHLVSKPILGKDDDFKDFLNDNTKIAVMMMGDPDLASLKKGDIIQIQRKGFFICDEPYDPSSLRYISRAGPIVLISIPDGSKDISMLPKQVKSLRTTKESSKEALNRKKGKLAEKSPQEETKQFSPTIPTSPLISSPGFTDGENALTEQIKEQGDRIRIMKSENCSKDQLKPEINTLLKLKSDYKNMMGKDWKPITETQTPKKEANTKNANNVPSKKSDNVNVQNTAEVDALNDKIKEQGDRIRIMKSQSCSKDQLKPEINTLLKLKSDYKNMMGKDWKPITETQTPKKEANTKNANHVSSKKSDNANVQNTAEVDAFNDKIKEQGDKIRLLKSQNCSKDQLKSEIDSLLKLKAEYKKLVGKEWKPDTEVKKSDVKTDSAAEEDRIAALSDNANVQNTAEVDALNDKIKEQGDKIRILKSQNCSKDQLNLEVDSLLKLKAEYKKLVGKEWKPDTEVKKSDVKTDSAAEEDRIAALSDNANVQNTAEVDALNDKIKEQGDKIRILKSQNCSKDQLKSEIDSLLKLKAEYKKLVGKEWKPDTEVKKSDVKTDSAAEEDRIAALSDNANVQNTAEVDALNDKIKEQGDKIRILKSQNCSKDQLKSEIDSLLQLKAEYKKLVGKEWKPDTEVKKSNVKTDSAADEDKIAALDQQIKVQGDEIRKLKAEKASKDTLAPCINTLLKLKVEYSKLVGKEWKPTAEEPKTDAKKKEAKITESKAQNSNSVPKDKKGKTNSIPKPAEVKEEESDSSLKKITRLGLEARKEENLADWYSQTITKAEMIEYYDVSGCYILRPWAFGIWESIVNFFDPAIKALGVSNSYFPMFVSPQALEKEKSHIADFAPEVAWVTRSGNTDLAEPIAIRPTSETVMYPSYAKWIRSHRDLPLKLNQWCSVVRWEFKHPQPFLRTREFLWQEGHTAFATQPEAVEEVYKILELYAQVYESLLAIPVVRGQKTEKEKFAGADFTTTVEAFVAANGRAIQGATSHHLGQNFSKMFEIVFDDPETNEKCFAYQNSWGLTTRTIGVMVMIHGDNMGLVLPPRVAVHQIVIVPCGITATLSDADKASLLTKCSEFESNLRDAGVRVKGDYRDNYSPGWKYNHWELKGVPIRIELGPRDIKKNQFVAVRRDTGAKSVLDLSNGVGLVKQLLDEIHNSMYAKAKRELDENMVVAVEWNDFCTKLDGKCIIQAPFCGEISCEDKIKKDSARNADDLLEPGAPSMGAKGLCIPFQQPREITSDLKCINPTCMKKPKYFTLFGRSY